jgi:hypothetical protein
MTFATQQRISIKNLKVAESASDETLCFNATVLLDNEPIAHASNEGRGGTTYLRPLQAPGTRERLSEAEEFAKSLPAITTNLPDPNDTSRKMCIHITLDYLVDHLAEQQHIDKKVTEMFNRDMKSKLLFFKGDQLLFIKGVQPDTIADKPTYFAKLRAMHGSDIVILDELPREEAFQRWKNQPIDFIPT